MSQDKTNPLAYVWELLPFSAREAITSLMSKFKEAPRSTQVFIGVGCFFIFALLLSSGGSENSIDTSITFEVRRGDLDITVLEGGALEALQSQEIRSRIKGREGVKILNIIEEGYQVTPEDVENGLVLVELDKSSLIDQQLNQEIAVETAEATYIERKAQFEIQLNENMTELNDARQSMRFARLDFEKFLGGKIVGEIVSTLDIEGRLARAEAIDLANQNAANRIPVPQRSQASSSSDEIDLSSLPPPMQERIQQQIDDNDGVIPEDMLARIRSFQSGERRGPRGGQGRGNPGEAGLEATAERPRPPIEAAELTLSSNPSEPAPQAQLLMDDSYMEVRAELDFTQYADITILEDGEAKQQLRSLLDELQVAQEEYLLAQDRIEGQRRLEARGFITPTELEAEELNLSKANNKQAEKETALKLYIQYTFPKDAEQRLSDFENAVMGYQRQLKENVAERAQEEARFSSAERKFNLERVKLNDLEEQIDLATIIAQRPGLVVYGGANQGSSRFRSSSQEAIQEGATIRERQSILTIPDMREMAIKVNIHESAVQRVAVGQKVEVSIDAFPDETLSGVVTKVAVVADSANAFMNPDLKVYPTTIKIDGTHEWLRPGMSSEVEILIESLQDVLYVPVQAVTYFDDARVVYVARGGSAERREVEVGTFSDSFIEITEGLREGEEVLLLPPQQGLSD